MKERATVLSQVVAENNRLKEELSGVESPGFVEKEARDKLGLVMPGEQVVIIGKQPQDGQKQEGIGQNPQNLPNWKQWWRLFF